MGRGERVEGDAEVAAQWHMYNSQPMLSLHRRYFLSVIYFSWPALEMAVGCEPAAWMEKAEQKLGKGNGKSGKKARAALTVFPLFHQCCTFTRRRVCH